MSFREVVGEGVHFFDEILLILALPWGGGGEELVEDNSNREDIALR